MKKENSREIPISILTRAQNLFLPKILPMDFSEKGDCLSALEIISISLNIKKSIMAKALSIGFSQVAESKDVRKFLEDLKKRLMKNKAFTKIMQMDNLPVPKSLGIRGYTSKDSPFSDKLMLYHIGFLAQTAQIYHGAGLASAMRTDLVQLMKKQF